MRERETADQAKRAHQDSVFQTDKELEEEGFPGFLESTDAVGVEIKRLVRDDPLNKDLYGPAGWKKVFKETVFPQLSAKFDKLYKADLFDKKKKLKSTQKITGKTGAKSVQSQKSDDDWSYDDYVKYRQDHSFA